MTDRERTDLLALLDALCEERLTADQLVRLDRAVVNDPEARRLYLDYIELHGMLTWDVAGGAVDGFPASLARTVESPSQARRARRRRLFVAAGLSAAAAVLLFVFWRSDRPRNNELNAPVIVENSQSRQGLADPIGPPIVIGQHNPAPRSPDRSVAEAATDQPPANDMPAPSSVATAPDTVTAINIAIAAKWEEADIDPSPVAEDSEWVRRAYLDLAGRIPTAGEAEQFLNDSSPNKRSALIDQLLSRPETARHFATVWTNLLIGRASNPQLDRNGLYRFLWNQFASRRPWSETVRELIAAEGAAHENGAANFLLAHLNNEAVPATAVTARCFLGLQVQCTQCHPHPFYKDWGQDQFWELNSFFQQTASRPIVLEDGRTSLVLEDRAVGGPTFYETRFGEMKVAFPQFGETEVDPGEGTRRRQELARLIVSGDRPQLARAFVNRAWAHFFGHGFTSPVDDMGPHNPPTHPELLDRLAGDFVASDYDVQALYRAICNSVPYQLTSRPGATNAIDDPELGDPPLFSRMYVRPLTAEQLFDSLRVVTEAGRAAAMHSDETDSRRQEWLAQFFTPEQTDENCEATTFDGTLPQALAMMNGTLVQRAVSAEAGTRLEEILQSSSDETERIRQISLTVLSRYPTREELASVREFLRRNVRQLVQSGRAPNARAAVNESLRDLYWACLNSTEFVVNH